MEELILRVHELQEGMDVLVQRWISDYEGEGRRIYCRKGCANCCRLAVHATFPEALAVAGALTPPMAGALCGYVEALRPHLIGLGDVRAYLRTHRRQAGFCPFLNGEGGCGIYPVRPFSCRALLSTRNADYCGIDLSALHPLEKEAFLSSLDPSVVAFPTHYAAYPQELGRAHETSMLEEMAKRCGFSLSGNLALLVWLIRERDLAGALRGGKEEISELLVREGLSLPFLLRLERAPLP